MTTKTIRLRFHRRLRKSQRQVKKFGSKTGQDVEKHLIRRLNRLLNVRRFIISWLGLIILLTGIVAVQINLLSNYYQTLQPVRGGTYTEGVLGDFTTANPIYATSPVDTAVCHLVFSSLLTYNNQNQLVGDLASRWSVDTTGRIYTVHLKPHLVWQDGQPLTSSDVVFTYDLIQNPNAASPLSGNWQDVQVSAEGSLTVIFTLANPLTSFPYSLTNGIIPRHLLANIPAETLSTAAFNINPVGSGPFEWENLNVEGNTPQTKQEQITLLPFARYNSGEPKLSGFIVRAFHDQGQLVSSFQAGQLDGMSGLNSVLAVLAKDKQLQTYSMPLTAANMVFFNTSTAILSDTAVRQALVQAADVNAIINGLGYPVIPVREPLLNGQLAFNPTFEQLPMNTLAAAQELQSNGWLLGSNGLRYKAGQVLRFKLYADNDPESRYVTGMLAKEWRTIGVEAEVIIQDNTDLQNTVTFREYDALLYGISIGVDPDVYVYWGSNQQTVNFSEYSSAVVDQSLEAGRTRYDPALRVIKYEPFLQAWQQDAPALGLYQPRYLYLTRESVYGLTEHTINEATDRFNNVQNWEILRAKVDD
ncbi:MAG TPA: ABC transporter substrate-binding protein [Candidatus Saccharimonadales bacterium]|jgi:peptide/nickel transport system substrate-binding protein|nr:ABC transporter substrate-binding protein [Candidatus Saccharimonadales bacterium]